MSINGKILWNKKLRHHMEHILEPFGGHKRSYWLDFLHADSLHAVL